MTYSVRAKDPRNAIVEETLMESGVLLKESRIGVRKLKALHKSCNEENLTKTFAKSAVSGWSISNMVFGIMAPIKNFWSAKTVEPIKDRFGGYNTLKDAVQAGNADTQDPTVIEMPIQAPGMYETCEKVVLCANNPNGKPNDHNVGFFTYVTGAICIGVGVAIAPAFPGAGASMIGAGFSMIAQGVSLAGEETARRRALEI